VARLVIITLILPISEPGSSEYEKIQYFQPVKSEIPPLNSTIELTEEIMARTFFPADLKILSLGDREAPLLCSLLPFNQI
jgi:hypothetical protein